MLKDPQGMRLFDIVRVKEEAVGCFSYFLAPVGSGAFRFLPGQFLTFVVEINKRLQRRPYSISASLEGGKQIRITVKKVDNGAVSRHIIAHWKTGQRIKALEAAGRFVLPDVMNDHDRFVFIAAGSGITPVFALLQFLIENRKPVSILLVTQFRQEKEIIFNASLKTWQRDFPRLEWISFLSSPEDRSVSAERLNNEKLEALLTARPGFNRVSTRFYLCGPLTFMRMAAFTLREMGVPEENIRRELFDPPRQPESWFNLDPAPHRVTLKQGDQEIRFTAAFPDSIMDAAAKAGVNIPFSCKAGICSTCVMRCISGSVNMRINEVLTDIDLREGLVLTCVGYAGSDLILEQGL